MLIGLSAPVLQCNHLCVSVRQDVDEASSAALLLHACPSKMRRLQVMETGHAGCRPEPGLGWSGRVSGDHVLLWSDGCWATL